MSDPHYETVWLRDRRSWELCEALLVEPIAEKHLQDFGTLWVPYLEELRERRGSNPEEADWDWRTELEELSAEPFLRSFAIELEGRTEGMMVLTERGCRTESQSDKRLIYVEFIQSAPWNRPALTDNAEYGLVGPVLLAAAIRASEEEGLEGRIGLHSLRQSEAWYRQKCKMTDLGTDTDEGYTYFEMTSEQAQAYLEGP